MPGDTARPCRPGKKEAGSRFAAIQSEFRSVFWEAEQVQPELRVVGLLGADTGACRSLRSFLCIGQLLGSRQGTEC